MREVVLGAAAALLVVIAVTSAAGPGDPGPPFSIVADNGGALREAVIHFDAEVADVIAPTYRDLLRAVPSDVVFHVVVANDAAFDRFRDLLGEWEIEAPERFQAAVVNREVTTWSRDRYTLITRGDSTLLLVPPRPSRGHEARTNDWLAPFAVAAAAGADTRVKVVPLVFDGGDLVATETHVFVTALLAARNEGHALASHRELRLWLSEMTGKRPVILGSDASEVPAHHIGMFVTPLTDDVILVGDPDLGLRLLTPELEARLPRAVDRREETLERFRLIAAQLEQSGFTVIRSPLIPLDDDLVYVTYNNSVLERRADGRLHAYVPAFGLAALDAAGRAVYEQAGIVVHPIDVERVFRHRGTVRCLINVLRRA